MAVIKSIMKTDLHITTMDENTASVAEQMARHNAGAVLVVKDDKLAGIFSERDLVTKVISKHFNPVTIPVGEVMTRNPIAVKSDTRISECVKLVRKHHFRHLPIIDEEEKPIGIISTRDFLQYLVGSLEQLIDEAQYKDKIERGYDPYEFIGGSYQS